MTDASARGRAALLFAGGLVIAIGLPQLGIATAVFPGDGVGARFGRELAWLAIGILLLLWIRFAEKAPLSSIGLRRPTAGTLLWGIAGAAAMIASFMLCYAVIFPLFGLEIDQARTGSIIHNPYWLQLVIFACAGLVEEIIYRGYLIERIAALTGSVWLAFLLSAVAFTLVHLASWAPSQLIVVAFGAAILGLLYVWKRDLILVMIAHFLADLVGFALAALQQH
jgi:membrane protease YdiL (CAAX protease family)